MHRKSITVILGIVFCLGLVFQYNRIDGFLRLFKNTNAVTVTAATKERALTGGDIQRERFLLVYDPRSGDSIRLRANVEKTLRHLKKEVKVIRVGDVPEPELNYCGIILATPNLDVVKGMEAFRKYVHQGGKLYFTVTPTPGAVFTRISGEIGFNSVEGVRISSGLKMISNLLIGGKGLELNGNLCKNNSLVGNLDKKAQVHMMSLDGVPLLWECSYGQGAYVFYNGTNLQQKENRGVLTGMLGLGRKVYVYPVIGIKTVCIDDFPAPFPEGYHEQIANYGLTIPDFFRRVWWPDMLSLAERYNVKYTGLIIETYNAQVRPPFAPEGNDAKNRNNMIVYGRELLKSGGELGVHGYNHQPLVTKFRVKDFGYTPWPSKEEMEKGLLELKRYIENVYPDYKLKVYVPPSNILSLEGRQALIHTFPDLKVIASLHFGNPGADENYFQEYRKAKDGIWEMPRLSVDYSRSQGEDWNIFNSISFLGVFSHFVHPDNIFYEENANKSWKELFEGFESLLKMVHRKFGWLRSCTLSQGGEYLEDYLNMDYRLVAEGDHLYIYSWGFRDDAFFILRTHSRIKEAKGCQVETIDENVYLLRINQPEVNIRFESGAQ